MVGCSSAPLVICAKKGNTEGETCTKRNRVWQRHQEVFLCMQKRGVPPPIGDAERSGLCAFPWREKRLVPPWGLAPDKAGGAFTNVARGRIGMSPEEHEGAAGYGQSVHILSNIRSRVSSTPILQCVSTLPSSSEGPSCSSRKPLLAPLKGLLAIAWRFLSNFYKSVSAFRVKPFKMSVKRPYSDILTKAEKSRAEENVKSPDFRPLIVWMSGRGRWPCPPLTCRWRPDTPSWSFQSRVPAPG